MDQHYRAFDGDASPDTQHELQRRLGWKLFTTAVEKELPRADPYQAVDQSEMQCVPLPPSNLVIKADNPEIIKQFIQYDAIALGMTAFHR